jgi:hypothetical protein
MKLSVVALSLAAAHTASAFHVRQPSAPVTSTSLGMSSHHQVKDFNELSQDLRPDDILGALGTLEGPSICYGWFARVENKRELDIKEYDNFDFFKAAIDQADCTKILRGNGPFTVFAPTNSAIENWDGVLTEEVIKTHIIPQDLFTDELKGTFETLSGHTVTCKSQFRKLYVDNALIGQLDNHSGGTPYPTNVICENGVIHTIKTVLTPDWTPAVADSQAVQGLSLQSHLNQEVLKERGALPEDAQSKF